MFLSVWPWKYTCDCHPTPREKFSGVGGRRCVICVGDLTEKQKHTLNRDTDNQVEIAGGDVKRGGDRKSWSWKGNDPMQWRTKWMSLWSKPMKVSHWLNFDTLLLCVHETCTEWHMIELARKTANPKPKQHAARQLWARLITLRIVHISSWIIQSLCLGSDLPTLPGHSSPGSQARFFFQMSFHLRTQRLNSESRTYQRQWICSYHRATALSLNIFMKILMSSPSVCLITLYECLLEFKVLQMRYFLISFSVSREGKQVCWFRAFRHWPFYLFNSRVVWLSQLLFKLFRWRGNYCVTRLVPGSKWSCFLYHFSNDFSAGRMTESASLPDMYDL